MRFDLREPGEAQAWRAEGGIAEASRAGLKLSILDDDPRITRSLGAPRYALDRITVHTVGETESGFVAYPRIRGEVRETFAVPLLKDPSDPSVHAGSLASLALPFGGIEGIRIDPPAGLEDVTLGEVVLDVESTATRRALRGESRACRFALTARLDAPLPDAPMALSVGLSVPFREADPGPLTLRLRRDGDPASVVSAALPTSSEPAWQTIELDVPANSEGRLLEVVDAQREPVPSCFAAPRIASERTPSDRPDVLLISIDTLRADRLETAAFLRSLGERGRNFERTWSSSNWTLPAHASLFTSTPPVEHDTPRSHERPPFAGTRLPERFPTLAETLAAAGYRTGASTGGGFLDPSFGIARGFERYRSARSLGGDDFSAHLEAARDFLEEAGPAPAFLFIHTYAVHDYFTNTPAYHGRLESDRDRSLSQSGSLLEAIRAGHADPEYAMRLYEAGVENADGFVRALVESVLSIRQRALLVIVTSDHGESLGERGMWHHGTSLFDEQTRIPLFVWGNFEGAPSGGRTNVPTSLVDVAPSLLSFLGIDVPTSFRGARDRFAEHPEAHRSFPILASTPHTSRPSGDPGLEATLVANSRKVIAQYEANASLTSGDPPIARSLCDEISEDPTAGRSLGEARCDDLRDRLIEHRRAFAAFGEAPQGTTRTRAEQRALEERLEALGYLQTGDAEDRKRE